MGSGECEIGVDDKDSFELLRNNIEYNPNCNLQWVGKKITSAGGSFAIKASEKVCSSLLRDVLNLHLLEMSMDGALDRIKEAERNVKTNNCSSDAKMVDDDQLTISDLSGAFLFLGL